MPRIYGHTWLLMLVTAILIAVASVLMFSSQDHLQEAQNLKTEKRTEYLATYLGNSLRLLNGDEDQTAWLIESARLYEDLAYLMLVDEKGHVLASINEPGAIRWGYNFPATVDLSASNSGVLRSSFPVPVDSLSEGILYLGMSEQLDPRFARSNKRLLEVAGSILFVLVLVLVLFARRFNGAEKHIVRLRKSRIELASEMGSLESKVSEQEEKASKLIQSEQRYKSLLESTMQSAFKDLEKQKQELEVEVEEKTVAQRSLKLYAERLSVLNSIEGKLVEESSLEDVTQHALEELQGLLNMPRASVVRIEQDGSTASVLVRVGVEVQSLDAPKEIPIDQFRTFKRGLFVTQDLSKLPEKAPSEETMLKEGMRSYCRMSLTADEKVVGALNVGSDRKGAFSEYDLKVIRDVADLLSIAFRQNLHKEERNRYELELISERDRAEEMARLKTAFLTNMTHEIRTPLSGIIGFAQVLHDEMPEEQREFTGLIQESAQRLLLTINSVLDLSKLEANKESFDYQVLDASQVVSDSVRLLIPLAERKNLTLDVVTGHEVPVRLDRNALEAIVNNIVGNAIKFTENGGVTVSVSLFENVAILEVQDTGSGISENFLPHLFDEFRQEYMDADRPHEGSGLGMAITSRLINKMGGAVEVRSKVGAGSIFKVSFPCHASKADQVSEGSTVESKALERNMLERNGDRAASPSQRSRDKSSKTSNEK